MRRIAVLDAPSNLGLRPPTPTSVPGCAKAPGALRDHALVARLGARDAGCHTPPRFDPGSWRPGDGVSQAGDIARYTLRLADRIGAIIDAGEFALVLGGDCSITLGSALTMRRLGEERGARFGLVYVDAHSDFRHPGNAAVVGAAAGEALALATGRGQADLAAIEQRRPYLRDTDVVLVGLRVGDEYRMDLQASGFSFRTVPEVRAEGGPRTAQWARAQLAECQGFWVHLDVDVLDPSVMPAVDAPDPGGIAYPELELLLRGLVGSPECLGLEVTVFDPDFDLDGVYAQDLVNTLVAVLGHVTSYAPALGSAHSPASGHSARSPVSGPSTPPTHSTRSPVSAASARSGAPAIGSGADRSGADRSGAGGAAPDGAEVAPTVPAAVAVDPPTAPSIPTQPKRPARSRRTPASS